MSVTAYFIGGSFDMTKRCLNARGFDKIVKFYEPPILTHAALDVGDGCIKCDIVEYRLQFVTQSGVGIYEYERPPQ